MYKSGHIKSLKDERSEMDMDLRLATSTKVCGKDGIDEGLMKTLLQNYIEYKTLCLREKEEIRVLDKQVCRQSSRIIILGGLGNCGSSFFFYM